MNHTDKTYKNNAVYVISAQKKEEKKSTWKLYYLSRRYYFEKIKEIKAQKNSKVLEVKDEGLCRGNYEYSDGYFLICSLNGGERKIAFGFHPYGTTQVREKKTSDCKEHYTWDIHPVWQEKELTITIEKDGKITFSDPKIKEVKKLKARENNEEIELKNLEIVPCDEE